MMNFSRMRRRIAGCALSGLTLCVGFGSGRGGAAQAAATGNNSQQMVFAGLRTVSAHGQVVAVRTNAAGELYLLLNEGDGVRLIKTDNAASAVLAQAQLGAEGDAGVGLALDPAGNVYVAGTTTSASFAATGGAVFGTRTGSSTNSFVARFTAALNPVFVTYTGGSRIVAGALAATSDAVFVTGITYASDLPVTANGVQQAPAPGSAQSGFVERFSTVSPPASRVVTVSNLGSASQTFTSTIDNSSPTASPFAQSSTDCASAGSQGSMILGPNRTCHITISFDASAVTTGDGHLQSALLLGSQDVLLTATSQAAALDVSATEVDFGTQIANGLRLPRYLYLSNNSSAAVSHAPLAMVPGSPFTVQDGCSSTLQPHSVCRIRLDYLAAQQTSTDSTTLTLDDGLSVLVTGKTVPAQTVTGTTANPNLSVTPLSATFPGSTVVTAVSTSLETVTISNTGPVAFALALSVTGDFVPTTNCGSTLAGHQNCLVQLSFAPSQPGIRQGLLSVTAGPGSTPVKVLLSGSATALIPVANGSLDFGNAVVGTPVERFFKVSQPFTSLTATATGPYGVALVEDAGFGPGQLPPSAFASTVSGTCSNCYLAVQFEPNAVGLEPGSVLLSSAGGGSTYTVSLTGTGTAMNGLVLTPIVADFGSVPVDSVSGSTLFTLTNLIVDGSDVAVSAPALSGDYRISTETTGGATCGGTLTYTASCFVVINFAPATIGARNGLLTFNFSGASGTQAVQASLSGIGSADPGIALNPTALSFRNVPGLSATRQTVTITNTSGSAVQVGTPTTTSFAFLPNSNCATLAAGASCSVTVSFVAGAAETFGTLSIPVTTSLNGSTQTATYTVALDGAYTSAMAGLQIVPGQVQFGSVATETEGPIRQFTVNNLTTKSLALSIAIPRNFVLVGPACTALAPNASCNLQVEFLPLIGGDLTGSLFAKAVPSDGTAALSAIGYLEGFGAGRGSLTISGGLIASNVFNFDQVTSGQTVTQVFTLTNSSSDPAAAPITIRRVTAEPPFLSSVNCGLPLSAGQSCAVSVTYAPINQVSSGASNPSIIPNMGALVVESDAASSPNVLDLEGRAAPVGAATPNNAGPLATFSLSQGSLTFASTMVGDVSAPQTITLANTGTVPLHLNSLLLPADFTLLSTCTTVPPGQSCALTVTSTPVTAGTHIGALQIGSDAATALEFVSLFTTSTPSTLITTPQSLDFGAVVVGTSSTLAVQVTNSSSTNVTFNRVSATGDYVAGGSCPLAGGVLTANSSCTIEVSFTPTTPGTRPGVLLIATSASTLPLQVGLTGVGIQSHLVVTPTALAFGNVVLGIASNQTLTLANMGTAPVTNIALMTRGDYSVSIPCAIRSLAPGQSCSVQITFLPTVLGERDGTLTVTSSESSSPLMIPLTGAGIQNGGFSLTVDGGSSSTVAVRSGQPATYRLMVSPTLGFTGAVALTCTPVLPAIYASCSIAPAQITLVSSPLKSVATVMTLASLGGNARMNMPTQPADPGSIGAFLCLLLPGAFGIWRLRKPLRGRLPVLLALIITAWTLVAIGCGSGADPRIRYAPVGTYKYLVTASSTSGVQNSQTVTLNLTITSR